MVLHHSKFQSYDCWFSSARVVGLNDYENASSTTFMHRAWSTSKKSSSSSAHIHLRQPRFNIRIISKGIAQKLFSRGVHKSPGLEDVPSFLECGPPSWPPFVFFSPLSSIFLPLSCHGKVQMFPNPKRGNPFDPNSYCPISAISINSKVFGTTISGRQSLFLKRKGPLSDGQYRYRGHRSTGGLLILVGCTR